MSRHSGCWRLATWRMRICAASGQAGLLQRRLQLQAVALDLQLPAPPPARRCAGRELRPTSRRGMSADAAWTWHGARRLPPDGCRLPGQLRCLLLHLAASIMLLLAQAPTADNNSAKTCVPADAGTLTAEISRPTGSTCTSSQVTLSRPCTAYASPRHVGAVGSRTQSLPQTLNTAFRRVLNQEIEKRSMRPARKSRMPSSVVSLTRACIWHRPSIQTPCTMPSRAAMSLHVVVAQKGHAHEAAGKGVHLLGAEAHDSSSWGRRRERPPPQTPAPGRSPAAYCLRSSPRSRPAHSTPGSATAARCASMQSSGSSCPSLLRSFRC